MSISVPVILVLAELFYAMVNVSWLLSLFLFCSPPGSRIQVEDLHAVSHWTTPPSNNHLFLTRRLGCQTTSMKKSARLHGRHLCPFIPDRVVKIGLKQQFSFEPFCVKIDPSYLGYLDCQKWHKLAQNWNLKQYEKKPCLEKNAWAERVKNRPFSLVTSHAIQEGATLGLLVCRWYSADCKSSHGSCQGI